MSIDTDKPRSCWMHGTKAWVFLVVTYSACETLASADRFVGPLVGSLFRGTLASSLMVTMAATCFGCRSPLAAEQAAWPQADAQASGPPSSSGGIEPERGGGQNTPDQPAEGGARSTAACEAELSAERISAKQCRDTLANFKASYKAAREKVQELEKTRIVIPPSSQDEVQQLRQKVQELRDKQEKVNQQLNRQAEDSDQKSKELQQMQATVGSMNDNQKRLEQQLDDAQKEVATARNKIAVLVPEFTSYLEAITQSINSTVGCSGDTDIKIDAVEDAPETIKVVISGKVHTQSDRDSVLQIVAGDQWLKVIPRVEKITVDSVSTIGHGAKTQCAAPPQSRDPVEGLRRELESLKRRNPGQVTVFDRSLQFLAQLERFEDERLRGVVLDTLVAAHQTAAGIVKTGCRIASSEQFVLPVLKTAAQTSTQAQANYQGVDRQLKEMQSDLQKQIASYANQLARLSAYGRSYVEEELGQVRQQSWATRFESSALPLVERHIGELLSGRPAEPDRWGRELAQAVGPERGRACA